jgi:hypothetical protein
VSRALDLGVAGFAVAGLEGKAMRRPAISLRLGRADSRRAVVLRIEATEQVALVPVASAALLAAALLCATETPPIVAGVPVLGYGVLAVALALVARIVRL